MNQHKDEALGMPPESYVGEEIDSIQMTGSTKIFQEAKILLNNGEYIRMRAKMNLPEYGIVPQIIVDRGKWGRLPTTQAIKNKE